MYKLDSDGKPDKVAAEPFAEEARFYVESRLLQRDIDIMLETVSNNNFVGSINHPVSKSIYSFVNFNVKIFYCNI